jgi:hypothetical protein
MPLTFLAWRSSHHQAIGPIRDRVIPTGSLRLILKDSIAIHLDTFLDARLDTFPDAGPLAVRYSLPKEQAERRSDRLRLAVGLC